MYIGFLLLYLLTSDLSIFSKYLNPQVDHQYTDRFKTVIDLNTYCDNSLCVVKCCDLGEVLDDEGKCVNATKYKDEDKRSTMPKEKLDVQDFHVGNETFKFILAPDTTFSTYQYRPTDIYISQNGSLRIKLKHPTVRWIEAPPLGFCMESNSYDSGKQNDLTFVLKLATDHEQAFDQLKVVATGLFISLIILLVLVLRIKPRIRNTLAPILMAITLTAAAGYILKIVQLYSMYQDIPKFSECSLFSPAYYFFILSSFFWSIILIFDLWWRIRSFRLHKRQFHHRDYMRFLLYCVCAWGIPLLMTMAAVAVNVSKINRILPIETPPFDSCFTNEMQSILYLHVPVSLLVGVNCVFFTMFIYHIVQLMRAIYNSPHYETIGSPKLITRYHKVVIWAKLLFVIGAIYMFTMLPGMHLVPYVAYIVYSVYLWTLLFYMFVVHKSMDITKRNKLNQNLSEMFQAPDFLKEVKKNAISGTLFESLKKGEDTEKIINKNDNNV